MYLSDPFMKILVSMFHIGLCWMQCKALWVFAWLSLSLGLDLLSTPKSLGLVLVLKHSSLGQDLVSVYVVLTTVLVYGAKKCDSGQRNLFDFEIIWQNVFFYMYFAHNGCSHSKGGLPFICQSVLQWSCLSDTWQSNFRASCEGMSLEGTRVPPIELY